MVGAYTVGERKWKTGLVCMYNYNSADEEGYSYDGGGEENPGNCSNAAMLP